MERRFFFITRVPDGPGSLREAARVITEGSGNINRIHYDRRIDPATVFFEVTAGEEMAGEIPRRLRTLGFLQSSLPAPEVLGVPPPQAGVPPRVPGPYHGSRGHGPVSILSGASLAIHGPVERSLP